MSRTLSQLQTDLNVKLTDQGGRILTSTQSTVLLNEALLEWCARTEELKRETALAVVAKQFMYDAPTDIIKIKFANFLQNSYMPLEVLNEHELQDRGGYFMQLSPGTPSHIIMEGTFPSYKLRLFPAPIASSQATTISDAGGISSSDTTIGVAAVTGLRTPSTWVQIESEKVLVQNISSLNLLLCVRGMAGTSAASHADSAAVTQCDIHIGYIRKATALASANDVPEIDDRWHKFLVEYALKEALRLDRRLDAAQMATAMWESAIKTATAKIRRVNGASPASFMWNEY